MLLRYVAIDGQGREVRGEVEAPDLAGGAAALRARGLFPVELAAALPSAAGGGRGRGWPGIVRSADVALFCTQMALMLRTGLTLVQALLTLAERASKPALRRAAERIGQRVQQGASLSDAMRRERHFPPLVVQLVRTAEATGELERAFDRAAEYLERRAALRFQVLSSLLYPAIVVFVSLGVFWFLALKVVPKFARFLSTRRVALPWTTQALLDVSAFLQAYGGWVLLGLGLAALAALCCYRTTRGRLSMDRAALRVPIVGAVLRAAGMAHLSRTLGMLLKSGLPLLQSLTILSSTFSNRSYARTVGQAVDAVVRGEGLAASLAGPGVPPLALQVIGVGEQTGALDSVLEELAAFYDRRLDRLLTALARLVEPALLLVVGGMVGFVYLSFFQAVFSLVSR